ncbi:MAG: hypothetical protein ACTHJ0_01755 [Flavipsychrobacter sp.]
MNRYIGYILLFIFSFQYLPVKAVAKLLKVQSIEEVQNGSSDDSPVKEKKDDLKKEFLSAHPSLCFEISGKSAAIALYRYQHYFPQHFPDTSTPPPDFC